MYDSFLRILEILIKSLNSTSLLWEYFYQYMELKNDPDVNGETPSVSTQIESNFVTVLLLE